MAQHDYNIANQTGANFRADLNNALAAIATVNSGATQPSTTFAHQLWVDTSSSQLKIRNAADNAWITTGVSITASNTFTGNLTGNVTGTVSSLSNHDTDNLSEGSSNLYYTDARARASISATGDISYNSSTGVISFTGSSSGVTSVNTQTGTVVLNTDNIGEGSSNLYFTNARANSNFDTRLATKSTSNLAEGSNLYYTTARARASISEGSTQLSYNSTTGVLTYTQGNTDTVSEGSNNLYYTQARFNSAFSNKTTANLTENTNLYYTDTRANSAIDARVTKAFVDALGVQASSVSANSVALGTDTTGNYIQTVTGTANKISVSGSGSESADVTLTLPDNVQIADSLTVAGNLTVNGTLTSLDTTNLDIEDNLFQLNAGLTGSPVNDSGMLINRGNQNNSIFMWDESVDKFTMGLTTADGSATGNITLATLGTLVVNVEGNLTGNVTGTVSSLSNHDTADLTEGSNLYYTQARFDSAFTAKSTSNLSEGTNLYYTDARFDTRLASKDTDDVSEGTSNLYFTDARAQAVSINNVVEDTTPQLGGNLDVNGNAIISTSNAAINLDPNGSGVVVFKGNSTKGSGQFKLNCENNTHAITIKGAPHSASANYTLTLPNDDGNANQLLKTDGSGVLSWATVVGGSPSITDYSNGSVKVFTIYQGGGLDVNVSPSFPQGAAFYSGLFVNGYLRTTDIRTASNSNIEIDPNGSGVVIFKGNATKGAGQFKLNCENNSHGITIKGAPHSAAASYTLTLPNSAGTSNQVLTTNGSGVLSWSTPSSGGSTTLLGLTDVGADGTSGQVLTTNGSGSFTFTTVSGGGSTPSINDLGTGTTALTIYSNAQAAFASDLQVSGAIYVTGTVDGVDIAARNTILTSTTTTANAALPKAGGTMTGNLTVNAVVDADNYKINGAQGTDGQVLTSTGSGVAWEDATGGGGGSLNGSYTTDIFTATSGQTAFTLSTSVSNENNLIIFIDGVFQAQNTFSVSGTTLTFATGIVLNRIVTVYHIETASTVTPSDNTVSTAKIVDDAVTSAKLDTNIAIGGTLNVGGTGTFTGLVDAAIIDGANFKVNGTQGTDGQVLTSTGSGVAWEDASGGGGGSSGINVTKVSIASDQNIGRNTTTQLNFDTIEFGNSDSAFNTTTKKYTAPAAGTYQFTGRIITNTYDTSGNSTISLTAYIYKNNSALIAMNQDFIKATGSKRFITFFDDIVELAQGDVIDFRASMSNYAHTTDATIWTYDAITHMSIIKH